MSQKKNFYNINNLNEGIKRKLGEMNGVLIGLIDRIRMLDNDLIRLRSKLNTILTIRENQKKKNPK